MISTFHFYKRSPFSIKTGAASIDSIAPGAFSPSPPTTTRTTTTTTTTASTRRARRRATAASSSSTTITGITSGVELARNSHIDRALRMELVSVSNHRGRTTLARVYLPPFVSFLSRPYFSFTRLYLPCLASATPWTIPRASLFPTLSSARKESCDRVSWLTMRPNSLRLIVRYCESFPCNNLLCSFPQFFRGATRRGRSGNADNAEASSQGPGTSVE